jgi:hypothetical protein
MKDDMIETKTFKYGLYEGGSIFDVSNTSKSYYPMRESSLEDVKVTFYQNGNIGVIGKEKDDRINLCMSDVDNVNVDDIEEKYLITRKRWFSKKEYKTIKRGWFTMKKRLPFNAIGNKILIRVDK